MLLWKNGQLTEVPERLPEADEVGWVHLTNPTDAQVSSILGDVFGCHPLVLEDVMHFGQRPKLDRYLNQDVPHALLSFYALRDDLTSVEFCVVIGATFVVTVEREPVPVLADVRRNVASDPSLLASPGMFVYQLLDRAVDEYFQVIDRLEDRVDVIQHRVFNHPETQIGPEIFRFKRRLHRARSITSDARNVVGQLAHESFPFTESEHAVYFVDVYDHATRIVDGLDAIRDSLNGLLDLQMAQRANRMNEVMKTLTVIATIFMPLSFIVGLYGMNFKDIPELSWSFGYVYVWALMIAVAAVMMVYFKKKGWW
ncbi:magnesium/cobalt transporter CorA [Alicyclobacillus cycloheptanicus]|uniref:Magnesium transport protein CorA n=1 Tax=Alicyclobacillus cycloheptanicus TaxID=1457 RepID=A0ABT9XDM6_9BACL|nr:magnesium/cobalt transporter CorA [Alicyclobacillus cycloheptanicus]MDQ0188406.1 magnesium transporter [Alicyclobacillus cycloheptanicus]WDM01111.1 magnesium/cobalt transporter CorA [Alicyclobacillus cycloheptanicus]